MPLQKGLSHSSVAEADAKQSAQIVLDLALRCVWFAADDSVTMSVASRRRSANDESKGRRGYLPYCAPMLRLRLERLWA